MFLYAEMKRFGLTMTILLVVLTSMRAQDATKHEIAISYGYPTIGFAMQVDSDPTCDDFFDAVYKNDRDFGPLSLEYYYHASPLVSVGGVMTFIQRKKDINQNLRDGQKIGDHTCRNFALMPSLKLNWLRTRNFSVYSKIAVGVAIGKNTTKGKDAGCFGDAEVDKKKTEFSPMGQLSLVGIEAGGRLRAFGELGLGVQGVINAGLRYRF